MAWWEQPLAMLRGTRTPSAATGAAPVASVPARREWNDVPRLQRVLAEPIAPVAINDDFRDSLASFSNPSLLAPLSHRVDPALGGVVEGLAVPGRPHEHDGPELVVPRSAPAAPVVQRRTAWATDATSLAVVPLEYRQPVSRAMDGPSSPLAATTVAESVAPGIDPIGNTVAGPVATSPERSWAVAEPDVPVATDAAPAPLTDPTAGPASGAWSELPVAQRPAESLPHDPPAVQRTVLPGRQQGGTLRELQVGSGTAPIQAAREQRPPVQRVADTGHPPPTAPDAVPGPPTPLVQRAGPPASASSPATPAMPGHNTVREADVAAPDEPRFSELPLVVAPVPSRLDADAASPSGADLPDEESRPLLGERSEAPGRPSPATEPQRQQTLVAQLAASVDPRGAPLLQRFVGAETPVRTGDDAESSGWSSVVIPGHGASDAPTIERFAPPAMFAPPIAVVQRRASESAVVGSAESAAIPAVPESGLQRTASREATGGPAQAPLMLVRPPAAPPSPSGPAPGDGMSFADMFGGFAQESSDVGRATAVQRQADAEPAAESGPPESAVLDSPPALPAAAPTAAAPASAGGGTIDELAGRLYEPLAARLREELWLDRERAGWMAELG